MNTRQALISALIDYFGYWEEDFENLIIQDIKTKYDQELHKLKSINYIN